MSTLNPQRDPQLTLRLDDSTPALATRWCEGAELAYLGGVVRLTLDTVRKDALLEGEILHLPLPPQATPRQIQDRAEAWLRAAAKRYLNDIIAKKSVLAGRRPPKLTLSFAAHGHWAEVRAADVLRCNWRLIEQPLPIIDQILTRAIAALPRQDHDGHEADLFAAFAA